MNLKEYKMKPENFDFTKQAFPFHRDEDGQTGAPGIKTDDFSVTFTLQRGPVKEFGRNGCDVLDMVEFIRGTIEVFNAKVPCRENAVAITKLQEAEMWLRERTREREERGVEGTSGR